MLSVSNEHEITDSKWRVPQAIQQEDGQFCNTKHLHSSTQSDFAWNKSDWLNNWTGRDDSQKSRPFVWMKLWSWQKWKSCTAVRISLKHVQCQLPKLFGSHSCKGILWCVCVQSRAFATNCCQWRQMLLQNTANYRTFAHFWLGKLSTGRTEVSNMCSSSDSGFTQQTPCPCHLMHRLGLPASSARFLTRQKPTDDRRNTTLSQLCM
jgi:hypothetical protein